MNNIRRLCSAFSSKLVRFSYRNYSHNSVSSSFLTHGIHVFQCPDAIGIVAKLSDCIASNGGNILAADVFVPQNKGLFYSRTDFVFDHVKWPRSQMEDDFLKISKKINAVRSILRVPALDPKYKIAVLASNQGHCLIDSLHGWQDGRLPVDITCVISNHDRGPESEVIRFLERHGIPFHYLRTTTENKREEDILKLVQNTDFLVLARYMQAYDAGVKLIGATSHFVTEGVDAGPIIEQMVERVSHRDDLQSFVQKSENLEKQCLSMAIRSYCELRVLPYEEKSTVVF
ncbi:unnamed protein product [Trifolium pratense]|uniref:Uncharacterized protein n=1 Tax=Trifolium pratense TaxID=57577 RepID=A0ACB0JPE1_TRIPR|nr:unnamed protein product [Trifolium pratense]